MKKIGIDARFFGSGGKGLGRYTQKLVENLEKIDGKNQYLIFLRKENFGEYIPKNHNFKKVLANYRWYSFSEQILFPILLLRKKLDIVHFPHFNVPILYRKKIIVTIHDLILIHFPTIKNSTLNPFFYWIKFFAYRVTINSAIKRAINVIAVSNFTKNDIYKNYNINKEKVIVTYEACENFCYYSSESSVSCLRRYGIIKPYLLYVGNAYPHKNLESLALAFNNIRKKIGDISLVLVGRNDYFYSRLKEVVSNRGISGIIFPGYVTDKDLDVLYKNSIAYVFPSLYEGFGLPPLEAMSKGIPVLSSEHECMKEILNDSALFSNAENIEEFSMAIETIIKKNDIRDILIKKGYARSSMFSWEKMARETLDMYNK